MSEQVSIQQEEVRPEAYFTTSSSNLAEDSDYDSYGGSGWSVVQKNSSSSEDEEEEDLEDMLLESNSTEGENEQEDEQSEDDEQQESEKEENISKESEESVYLARTSSSSSTSLEDGSISSFNVSSEDNLEHKVEPGTVPSTSNMVEATSNTSTLYSSTSMQAESSSTTPSKLSSTQLNGLETEQAAEKTRQELHLKIKQSIISEQAIPSPTPKQEEDETINEKQDSVKKVSLTELFLKLYLEQQKKKPALATRICLACPSGVVRIVEVNGGKHQRWQCGDCKENYEWCPIVNPVSPKRGTLLETGGWDELLAKHEVKTRVGQKWSQPDTAEPQMSEEVVKPATQKSISGLEKQPASYKPAFSHFNYRALLFLFATLSIISMFGLGYFAWKYYDEVQTTAKLFEDNLELLKEMKQLNESLGFGNLILQPFKLIPSKSKTTLDNVFFSFTKVVKKFGRLVYKGVKFCWSALKANK